MDEAIRAFVRYLELERGASRETIRSYRSDLRQFVSFINTFNDPQFQPTTPTSIDSLTIRRYLRWLDEKKEKKSSLARKLATLKSFYRFLTKEGWTDVNPAAQVRSPRQGQRLPKVLTKDEANVLMEIPEGVGATATRDRAILETLYSTGARVSELVGLNWQDIDMDTGIIRLQGKGKKERIVPIGDIAVGSHSGISLFNGQVHWPREPRGVRQGTSPPDQVPVFKNNRGGRLSARSVERMVKRSSQLLAVAGRSLPIHSDIPLRLTS